MSAEPKIKIRELTKQWGEVKAIDKLDLDIHSGDFLTLLGPSGCGKTTTLRAIAGLEEPSAGDIYIDDKLVFSKAREIVVDPVKRGIGLIFQSYALWPHMTVYDNIAFGLNIKKLPSQTVRERTEAIIRKVHLEDLDQRYPSELSGGQQQRVAIARMLITNPDIFLMDEPLSNLDAKLRIEMRSELKRLHQDSGATTVYVTHDQEEAMTISTHICVMKDGIIHQKDTPEMLYRKPADLFVAEFISNPKMNFFDAAVSREGDKAFVEAAGFKIPHEKAVVEDRKSVKLAVRPEDFYLDDKGVDCKVITQLPTGPAQIIVLERDGLEVIMLSEDYLRVNPGDNLKIGIKKERENLFDLETRKRIF